MYKKVFLSVVFFTALSAFSQKDEVLLTINKEPVMMSEFQSVYEKNLDLVKDKDAKNIDKNLELFINYKLKVKQAYDLKLDTVKSYQREYKSYKNQLIAPYLQDKKFQEKLVKQAYDRTKEEIKASHILIQFPKKNVQPDTVAMYNKLLNARDRIIKGEAFEKVAKEISQDPSVKINGGNLGYFSAFRMVYPFEDNAYKTKTGEVSKPFKTRFGYHIVKVTARRASKGEFEVAHILAADKSIAGKVKIDSAYQELQQGKTFSEVAKKYSADKGTSLQGGKLPKFSAGRMVKPFDDAVLSLKKEGDYSKPFKTKYGWHIVKLLKNYPVKSFKDLQPMLQKKVRESDRGRLSNKAVVNKLKNKYTITENKKALDIFKKLNKDELKNKELSDVLLTINERKIKQKKFFDYSKYKKGEAINQLFQKFKDQEIINYYKDNLEKTNPEFKRTLHEYKDGLLLFELLQQKIWNKTANDTLALQNYFNKHKTKYKKPFKEVKGMVMSDYQKDLEENWQKELRKNNVVKIRKRSLKKLKKHYNQ